MKPLSDDELILHYYDESERPEAVRRRIADDPETRAGWLALVQLLDAVPRDLPVPERDAAFDERLWLRVEERLATARRRTLSGRLQRWLGARPRIGSPAFRWAAAAALLLLMGASFWAGERWHERQAPIAAPGALLTDADLGRRILQLAVAQHLGRTEMLLAEIANLPGEQGADLTLERLWAGELADAGRLYRQAATESGATEIVYLLTQLEPLLLELANSPAQLAPQEVSGLRRRLASNDVLFKVRVIGARLESQNREPSTGRPSAGV